MSFRFLTQEQLTLLDYSEDIISRRVNGVRRPPGRRAATAGR